MPGGRYARRCDGCGSEFATNRHNQRFCSKKCSYKRAARLTPEALPACRECARCGTSFRPVRRDGRFCSRACAVAHLQAEYLAHDPEYRAKQRLAERGWRLRNPQKCADYTKASRYRTRYGIEHEDFIAYVERIGSTCESCGVVAPLVPDHDHATGTFRGALCVRCNLGLGHFLDDANVLMRAAAYLIAREVPIPVGDMTTPPGGAGSPERERQRRG